MKMHPFTPLLLAALCLPAAAGSTDINASALYQQHCASCHSADRLGGVAPALLPENLARLRRPEAIKTISEGRIATQMPGFSGVLTADEIKAVADFVYTPLPAIPKWDIESIRSSRIEHYRGAPLPDKPVFKADPLNLFVVVELGDHHATILDGDRLEPITRFPTRFALHGGPKFSPDGRYVYFASRDGWITKYDIWNLKVIAEVRAGINTRNLAVSSDGKFAIAANYLPHTLVVLDTKDMTPIKVIDVKSRDGKSSRVSAVYDAAPRKSFVAALKDIPEVWEITYDGNAEPVYEGYVHDYKMGEGIAAKGPFPVRRIELDDYLDDFFFDASYDHLIGSSREGRGQVINLNVRRKIAELELPGMPHLGSGITWELDGRPVLATPNLKEGLVTVVDMKTWKTVKQVKTIGPGFFMRSHENARHAWVDAFNSTSNRDVMQILDKQKLEVVAELRPSPGKVAAHTEFTRDGKYALVSVWDTDGALVVYDAKTLQEVKRIPMNKPSGKYNVYNKVTRSAGTSH